MLHDVSHAINITSVVSVNDTLFLPSSLANHSTRPSLIRWLAQRERAFPKNRCCWCFGSLIIPSFFHSMFEKHSKHIKGFGRKLLNRHRHLSLALVGRCSSVVSARDWRSNSDRVVTASDHTRYPVWVSPLQTCIGALGKFVYPTLPVFRMRHNKLLVPSVWCPWRGK